MTIAPPTPPTVTPIDLSGYPSSHRSFTGVSSFTYDSAMTYTELVDSIRRWIPQVLIPWIGDNFEGFEQSWVDEADALQAYVTDALTQQNTAVNAAIAQATQDWASANVDITDPAMKAAVSTIGSATRTYLDSLYGAGAMTDTALQGILAATATGAPHTARDYLDTRFNYNRGSMWAAPATGVVATDTANMLAAISTAQAAYLDLKFTGKYALNQAITWNANRGSLLGVGSATLDFSTAAFTGAALTITGNGNQPTPSGEYMPHIGIKYVVEHFKLQGPDTDATTVDGILFTDPGVGADMMTVRHLYIIGFRDGVSYGTNTWSQSIERCFVMNSHRYGINLTQPQGTNSGECTAILGTSVAGTHNAAGTGVGIYAPAGSNIEFRMISGSLDYNDIEADIRGGSMMFENVHIEDRSVGPMFKYTCTTDPLITVFRDCSWDSSNTGGRDHIHEVMSGSTSGNIVIAFDGVSGGVGSQVEKWLVDNSGQSAMVSVRNWGMSTGTSTNMGIGGATTNLLVNGSFDDTQTFAATPGIRGWFAPNGSFTYSATNSGFGMRVVSATALSGQVTQRVRIDSTRRPLRVAGRLATTAYTSGAIGIYAQFYGEDGTTPVGGQFRLGSDVNTLTGGATNSQWAHSSIRLTPPAGAAYLTVILNASSFIGTGYWDDVEVVAI